LARLPSSPSSRISPYPHPVNVRPTGSPVPLRFEGGRPESHREKRGSRHRSGLARVRASGGAGRPAAGQESDHLVRLRAAAWSLGAGDRPAGATITLPGLHLSGSGPVVSVCLVWQRRQGSSPGTPADATDVRAGGASTPDAAAGPPSAFGASRDASKFPGAGPARATGGHEAEHHSARFSRCGRGEPDGG
jgi:hypothetical protein